MGRIIVDSSLYEPKPIVGYSDTISARPGDRVRFYVSCDGASEYRGDIVRLIQGDLNNAGPAFQEELIESSFSGSYPAIRQETYGGSYMIVDRQASVPFHSTGVSAIATVLPTAPNCNRPQVIVGSWSHDDSSGWALYVDETGRLAFVVGAGNKSVVTVGQPLLTRVWYLVCGTYDPASRRLTVHQEPILTPYNGRLALQHPSESLADAAEATGTVTAPACDDLPLMVGAWQELRLDTGKIVPSGHFNGKIDRPCVVARSIEGHERWQAVLQPLTVRDMHAAWDFSANISQHGVATHGHAEDVTPSRLHGRLVNSPARGMTGHNWSGTEYSFRHAPHEYGAIHFHDDDLTDCDWEPSCEFTVPGGLRTGIYAARIRATIDGVDEEDYIPFFVRPKHRAGGSRVLYIAPTASYLAYGNDEMAADSASIEVLSGAVPHMGENDLARQQHREFGSSLYDVHSDGSGVCYSSWMRPILTIRPKYRHSATRVWQFNADLHLIDWFNRAGHRVDVVTDHDLHAEGLSLLRGYRVAVTGTHPEYYSGAMLDALQGFVEEAGGRIMYLGGNGFYWVTGFSPEDPRIIEVRRWGGTEAWSGEPGQGHLSFTGEMGGLWRHRGRSPQKLVGVGFVAQGLDRGTYYARKPDGDLPETKWIFEGIGPTERIGDFGAAEGGAAGLEIDWYDPKLGSPGWGYVVAASEGHSRLMLEVRENVGVTYPYMGGDMDPRVRADMVYFKTTSGGAVFSTGSIAWCGSLSYNNYNNNVSRIMRNVVERFAGDEPLP